MFKETKEGQTHYYGDGCGEPAHNAPKDGKLGDNNSIPGTFDGQAMIAEDGRIFPVPSNYASKSKLIEGDQLKLSIDSGDLYYKKVIAAPRKIVLAKAIEKDNRICVFDGETYYNVLESSLNYYHLKNGEEVLIIIPESGETKWAAIESVIRKK